MRIILFTVFFWEMMIVFPVAAQMRIQEKQEQREELSLEEEAQKGAQRFYESLKRNLKTQFTREQEEQILELLFTSNCEYGKIWKERWNVPRSVLERGEVVIGEYDSMYFYYYKIMAARNAALEKVFTEKQNDAFVSYWEKNDEILMKNQASNKIGDLAFVFERKFGFGLRLTINQRKQMTVIAIESMQKKYENWKRYNYQLCDSLLAVDRQIDEAELAAFKKILTKEQYKTYVEYLKNE